MNVFRGLYIAALIKIEAVLILAILYRLGLF
jgi:hypothetical protein